MNQKNRFCIVFIVGQVLLLRVAATVGCDTAKSLEQLALSSSLRHTLQKKILSPGHLYAKTVEGRSGGKEEKKFARRGRREEKVRELCGGPSSSSSSSGDYPKLLPRSTLQAWDDGRKEGRKDVSFLSRFFFNTQRQAQEGPCPLTGRQRDVSPASKTQNLILSSRTSTPTYPPTHTHTQREREASFLLLSLAS